MRSVLSALAFGLLALGQAWCGQDAPSAETQSANLMETPTARPESAQVAAHLDPVPSAYREHAPLALFSLGSLAVGGVFYAISQGMDRPNISYTAGDRSSLTTAVSVAGVSALLAAGSYFYYVHRSREQSPPEWDARAAAVPDGNGGVSVAARLSLPLPGAL